MNFKEFYKHIYFDIDKKHTFAIFGKAKGIPKAGDFTLPC